MTHLGSAIEIVPATALPDVNLLRPVLESSVVDPWTGEAFTTEIEEDLRLVKEYLEGSTDRYYAIARKSGGAVVGMMGLQAPTEEMLALATTTNPIELINAYVLRSSREAGVGTALVRHIESKARSDGRTELLLNSGPRYQRYGWPFWRKNYGEPVDVLVDYYGPGFDAMVWRTMLIDSE